MTYFVDPQLRSLHDRVATMRAPSDVDDTVAMMRQMRGAAPAFDDLYPESRWDAVAHAVRRDSGRTVDVLIARPRVTGRVPVVVAVHGGGLISGTAAHGLREVAHLVDGGHSVAVVSIGYGLAPEISFDGAVRDCEDALSWLARRGASLGLDLDRMVVVGLSAGGAVATVAASKWAGRASGLLLCAPMLDERSASTSMRDLAGTGSWDIDWNRSGWAAARRLVSSEPAPIDIADLARLDRVYLDAGSADPLVDEVMTFAMRLRRSGSATELHVWPGAFHGSELAVPAAEISQRAQSARRDWLARTLG